MEHKLTLIKKIFNLLIINININSNTILKFKNDNFNVMLHFTLTLPSLY
jgi:hypothetical protein